MNFLNKINDAVTVNTFKKVFQGKDSEVLMLSVLQLRTFD